MKTVRALLVLTLQLGCGGPIPAREDATVEAKLAHESSGVLLYEGSLVDPWCGAVLIGEDTVLTAAHCMKDRPLESMQFTFEDHRSLRARRIRTVTAEPETNLAILTLEEAITDRAPAELGRDLDAPLTMVTSIFAVRGKRFEQHLLTGVRTDGPPDRISVRFPPESASCHGENGTGLYAGDQLVGIAAGGFTTEQNDGFGCYDVLTFIPVFDTVQAIMSR